MKNKQENNYAFIDSQRQKKKKHRIRTKPYKVLFLEIQPHPSTHF
ncbi:MAG: hypothetical protein PHU42_02475 [Patescibacteria group bacterium]|nr:hypothetical protein [Patescibacteria group bacterium]